MLNHAIVQVDNTLLILQLCGCTKSSELHCLLFPVVVCLCNNDKLACCKTCLSASIYSCAVICESGEREIQSTPTQRVMFLVAT